mgnify:CR=1 FL=1
MSDRFADELLRELADFPAARERVATVLRKWGGQRVYVHAERDDRPANAAQRLIDAHVSRGTAVAILSERFGLSPRHCRRLVGQALAIRGQTMSAPRASMAEPQPPTRRRSP